MSHLTGRTISAATGGATVVLAATVLGAATGASAQDVDVATQLAQARAAAAPYHRVASAEADGYGRPPSGPLHECISNLSGPGAMGYHWINGANVVDPTVSASTPEILVYEPQANGTMRLVALEYAVPAALWDAEHDNPPVLFGRELTYVAEPNRYEIPAFYEIHAWVGLHNPSGVFADLNPLASCDAAE